MEILARVSPNFPLRIVAVAKASVLPISRGFYHHDR